MIRFTSALAACAALLVAGPAFAQDAGTPADGPQAPDPVAAAGGDSITIGAGVAELPDYEGSDNYRLVPVPGAIGSYKGFNFTLAGNRLSVDLIPDGKGPTWDFQAGPVALLNFNRTSIKNIDDRQVRALGELDTAVELGGFVGVGKTGVITSPYDKLSVSISYRHDVSGVSHGGVLQPSINYLTPLSRKAAVGLFGSAEHTDHDYAQTYFGITPTQSAFSGLPTYYARSGWKSYTLGAIGTVSLTGDLLHGLKLVAGGTYRRLLNGYSYSPIVRQNGSPNQWLGAVGLAYTF